MSDCEPRTTTRSEEQVDLDWQWGQMLMEDEVLRRLLRWATGERMKLHQRMWAHANRMGLAGVATEQNRENSGTSPLKGTTPLTPSSEKG